MNKNDLFSIKDFEVQPVEVPEWKTTLHVRSLNGHGRARIVGILERVQKAGTQEAAIASIPELVALLACDENGTFLFDSQDIDRLGSLNPQALDRIVVAGLKLNGLADTDAKKN